MAHGLEVRVPLLANAHPGIACSGCRHSVHFDEGGGKAILRALARKHLPEAVWNREKHGFSVPLRDQLRRHLARLVRYAQVAAAKMRAPWLDAGAIARRSGARQPAARRGQRPPGLYLCRAAGLAGNASAGRLT
jgi:asparagine synthase (glutamine-hydrolysing)